VRLQKKESENQREAEKNEREKENQSSALERKSERKEKNFYAKVSEIKGAMFSNQPMIVLLYNEELLNTNESAEELLYDDCTFAGPLLLASHETRCRTDLW
jgi:hypothetical protein